MPWWIILVLVLAGGAVYLLRDKIKGALAKLPLIGRALADVASDVPALRRPESPYVAHPEKPTEPPNVPPPPPPPGPSLVDAPIVREADPAVVTPGPGKRQFGGPIPRGFGDRYDGLLEVTLDQIQEYVPTFDTEADRYFMDPSLHRASMRLGDFAQVAPELLVSQRATIEAKSIPVFSVSKLQRDGASAQEIQKARLRFIDMELEPALRKDEYHWLLETGVGMTGPQSVHRLARRRAEAVMPDWLRVLVPKDGERG